MNYAEFTRKLADSVQGRLGESREADLRAVITDNQVSRTGIAITAAGSEETKIVPRIFLESYYEQYKAGRTVRELTDSFLHDYEACSVNIGIISGNFREFSRVQDSIRLRIINAEKNSDLLKEMPHRRFLDLAVTCYYSPDAAGFENGRINVSTEDLEDWEISEEELFEIAEQNMRNYEPPVVRPLAEIVEEMGAGPAEPDLKERNVPSAFPAPLYVITGKSAYHGAVYMADPSVTAGLACKLGCDYYLLPSSVHEVIALPALSTANARDLNELVAGINMAVVPETQVLADHCYFYSMEEGVILDGRDCVPACEE